jgi:ferrous iron transport protein B
VGIFTGILAKETVVGTLNALYSQDAAVGGSAETVAEEVGPSTTVFAGLRAGFRQGQPQVYAYLLFVLLYVPCVAAFAAMTREMGLRYTLLAVMHIGVVAWSTAVLFYQVTVGRDPLWMGVALGLLAANVALFRAVGDRERSGAERPPMLADRRATVA